MKELTPNKATIPPKKATNPWNLTAPEFPPDPHQNFPIAKIIQEQGRLKMAEENY